MIRLTNLLEDIESMRKQFPKIEQGLFDTLIQLDPTYQGGKKQGDYTKWMLQLANKNALSDEDVEELPSILAQFKAYRNRIENKDLMRYKSVQELADAIAAVVDDDSMLSDRQKVRFHKAQKAGKIVTNARDDYDVVFEDSKFIVYVPNTHEASMFLGQGTDWCTAHENPEWYKSYTENGHKLYIVKNKETGDKWQYSDKNGDFLNQYDEEFEIGQLLATDAKLAEFMCNLCGVKFPKNGVYVYTGGQVDKMIASSIKTIRIDKSVNTIANYAFQGCYNLTDIEIPNTVNNIGGSAFECCYALKHISIPSSVKSIGDSAFLFCDSLETVKLENGLERIRNRAFEECASLKSIEIPDTVEDIGTGAFIACRDLKTVKLPKGLLEISPETFNDCTSLTSIVIPDMVYSIRVRAFHGCTALKEVKLPHELEEIGTGSFENCISLQSLNVPEKVVRIRDFAFYFCTNLTIKTNNEYVIKYCQDKGIKVEMPESLRRIRRLRIKD